MSTSRPFHVKQIDHVTIVISDLEKTRRFYQDLLGMKDVPRPEFLFQGHWFQAGSTLIHTMLEFQGSGPAGQSGGWSTRGHHIAFMVEDVREAESYLRENGVPVVSSCKLRPDGALQAFFHDPDGHLIELTSPPESNLSPGVVAAGVIEGLASLFI